VPWWKSANQTGKIADANRPGRQFIDTLVRPPYTEFTISKLGKWGSAVQNGRGPATVIGKLP
jgi:hypothetical protein